MTLDDLVDAVRTELETLELTERDSQVYAGARPARVKRTDLSCQIERIEVEPSSPSGFEVMTRSAFLLHFYAPTTNRGPDGAGLKQVQELEAVGPVLVRRWDGSQNAELAAASTASGLRLASVSCREEELVADEDTPREAELVLRLEVLEATAA